MEPNLHTGRPGHDLSQLYLNLFVNFCTNQGSKPSSPILMDDREEVGNVAPNIVNNAMPYVRSSLGLNSNLFKSLHKNSIKNGRLDGFCCIIQSHPMDLLLGL